VGDFREEIRQWLSENCPQEVRDRKFDFVGGRKRPIADPAFQRWFDACCERGLTAPTWPKTYGGGGLDQAEVRTLREEMAAIGAPSPLGGMGVAMIGPTLLEYGSDEQKVRHLPAIARGEVQWCQGYSEPGAGSDLASLKTRAVDKGDHYLINGSKIWTSGANHADWIFCLVRTDPDAPKHEGISFLLFSMDDPGVSVKPIVLINGNSPFCECFFDDVKADKADRIGQENRGWTIAKRLLQHERSFVSGGGALATSRPLPDLARQYLGEAPDAARLDEIRRIQMDIAAFKLTRERAGEESRDGNTATFATSMFKYYATEISRRRMECAMSLMGTQGLGWEAEGYSASELKATRAWLYGKALTIAGGSSEVQLNIIAKRVLGLPD
jgi:alkylation response protein AidB-like acyl-CoA dehydrogenase